jgi:hypothetical protein
VRLLHSPVRAVGTWAGRIQEPCLTLVVGMACHEAFALHSLSL